MFIYGKTSRKEGADLIEYFRFLVKNGQDLKFNLGTSGLYDCSEDGKINKITILGENDTKIKGHVLVCIQCDSQETCKADLVKLKDEYFDSENLLEIRNLLAGENILDQV